AIESSEEKVSEGEEETDVYDEATEAAFERLALDALDRARQGRSPLNKEALEAVVEWLAWYRDSPPPTEKSKSSDGVFGTRDLLTNVEGKEDKQAVPVAGASLKLANDGSDSAILEISVSKAVGDGNVVVGDEEEAVVTELDPASMVGDEVICSRSAPIVFDGKKLCDVACPAKNVLIDENICPVSSISRRMRNVEYKEKQLGVKNGGSSHALQVFDPLSESNPLPAIGRKASSPAKFSMKGYLGNEEGVDNVALNGIQQLTEPYMAKTGTLPCA
ncbi:hypothetical protein U1Q18_042799, partial [Sarracenia purpurea var. burkii]